MNVNVAGTAFVLWSGKSRPSSRHASQEFKRLISVRIHVELACDLTQQPTIRIDHEGRASTRQRPEAPYPELFCDLAIRIRKQREAEPVLLVEGLLPIHRIGADPYALDAKFCELALQVAEVTAFLRSTRGHGLWIEEEDEGPALEKACQTNLIPILVDRAEVIHDVVLDHVLDSRLSFSGWFTAKIHQAATLLDDAAMMYI